MFPSTCYNSRMTSRQELDGKHVEDLKRQFGVEGCRRENVTNHVPVLIDQSSLDTAIRASEISTAALLRTRRIDIQNSGYLSVAVSYASTENTGFRLLGNFFPLGRNGGWLISISQVSLCIVERGLFDQCIGRRDQRCPTKPDRGISSHLISSSTSTKILNPTS